MDEHLRHKLPPGYKNAAACDQVEELCNVIDEQRTRLAETAERTRALIERIQAKLGDSPHDSTSPPGLAAFPEPSSFPNSCEDPGALPPLEE